MLVEYVPGTFSFEKHTRSCAVRNKEPVDLKSIKVVQETNYLQMNYNEPLSANLDDVGKKILLFKTLPQKNWLKQKKGLALVHIRIFHVGEHVLKITGFKSPIFSESSVINSVRSSKNAINQLCASAKKWKWCCWSNSCCMSPFSIHKCIFWNPYLICSRKPLGNG